MDQKLSSYQESILDAVIASSKNLAIEAVAGSGKTFTLKLIARSLSGDCSAVFVAFSKAIVAELEKSGLPIPAKTVHAIGYAALRSRVKSHYKLVSEYKYPDLVSEYLRESESELDSGDVCRLIDLIRLKLADPSDRSAIESIIAEYDLDIDPAWIGIIPALLQSGEKLALSTRKGESRIDFTDMLYLPVKWGLKFDQWDVVLADEIQDFSPLQLAVIKQITRSRFIGVGDPFQAIMGFAGADCDSFQKVKGFFHCESMPLSICYRCPDAHLALARDFVPHIEGNHKSGTLHYSASLPALNEGDMIIARRTAPLVSECMRLIKQGKRAYVRAKDLDKSLIRTAKRIFNADPAPKFALAAIQDCLSLELDKIEPNPRVVDRLEALVAIWDSSQPATLPDLIAAIKDVFKPSEGAIVFSSIHASKGLESDNVVVLEGNLLPFLKFARTAEAIQQERNITYVAYTRAKRSLTIVSPEAPERNLAQTLIDMAAREFSALPFIGTFAPTPVYNRVMLEK